MESYDIRADFHFTKDIDHNLLFPQFESIIREMQLNGFTESLRNEMLIRIEDKKGNLIQIMKRGRDSINFWVNASKPDAKIIKSSNAILNKITDYLAVKGLKLKQSEIEGTFNEDAIDFPFYRIINNKALLDIVDETKLRLEPISGSFITVYGDWDIYMILPVKTSKDDPLGAMIIVSKDVKIYESDLVMNIVKTTNAVIKQIKRARHGGRY